ncbi:hypothetical protein ACPOL_6120 [Acidisarcina polymorpha]|uniref:Uncharacterized protein n=1 Tax=Acidisarcina polymorpha TaxID=2211140 RepID=A0A2Z5G9I9_9BACT|nr:hypothetical protein [Acidisarcina polymorpha]AXC15364.1 hypothetical protein ACPOL_6120 [Acidisarcina polymorpha]
MALRVAAFTFFLSCVLTFPASPASAQTGTEIASTTTNEMDLPDAPQAATTPQVQASDQKVAEANTGQQTKRILFIVPNFRSVSVDAKLPPLTPGQKFKLAFQDSFDYSSFIYVGIVAGIAQAQKSYPEFHQGAAGYGRYYWHSFADSVNENAFAEFIVPVATREDPRYYTLGRGGFGKRLVYSFSRLGITRTDNANETVNLSEIVGAGAAAGLSNAWYPSHDRTWTKTGQKWVTQIGIDGISNIAKEFWPDINQKVFRNKF